jgi:hypothetical protein
MSWKVIINPEVHQCNHKPANAGDCHQYTLTDLVHNLIVIFKVCFNIIVDTLQNI